MKTFIVVKHLELQISRQEMDYGSGPAVSLFVCLGPLAENLKRNLVDNFHQEIFLFVLVSHSNQAEHLLLSFGYLKFLILDFN